ncbi:hypothetical protein [Paraburkholderia sp. DGU8]|uniref:hypothetical protein n=1 Tax=Paraburkholderia sp. DGU8 TaxID=3161997 RepID=UPI003465D7D9
MIDLETPSAIISSRLRALGASMFKLGKDAQRYRQAVPTVSVTQAERGNPEVDLSVPHVDQKPALTDSSSFGDALVFHSPSKQRTPTFMRQSQPPHKSASSAC